MSNPHHINNNNNNNKGRHSSSFNRKSGNGNVNHYNSNVSPLFNQDATLAYMKTYGYSMYNPQYANYQNNYGYYPDSQSSNTMGMYTPGYRSQPHGVMNKKHSVHASSTTAAASSESAPKSVTPEASKPTQSADSSTDSTASSAAPSKKNVALSFMEQVAARRAAMLAKEPSSESKVETDKSNKESKVDKQVSAKPEESSVKAQEEAPAPTEKEPVKAADVPAVRAEEEAAIKDEEETPVEVEEEVPAEAEKAPVESQEVSPVESEREAPVKTEEASKSQEVLVNEIPVQTEEEIPVKIEDAPKTQEEESTTLAEASDMTEESKETEKPADAFMSTISQFMESIKNAKPIEDPYTFNYTAPFNGPDQKVHDSYKKTHKIKYDPRFLIQFREPISKFKYDDKWVADYKKRIIIPASSQSYSSSKNSGSRNQGGFGSFSKPSMSMRSQYGSKRGFTNDSGRSNSKQSSKRKGGSKRGDDSKRNNSKKYKDLDSKATQVLDKIDGQLKGDQSTAAAPAAPLPKSANRWVPRTLRNAAAAGNGPTEVKKNSNGTEWLSQDEVTRKINSLLNKLALENFDTISKEIKDIAEQSMDEEDAVTLENVLGLILAKACDEAHWSNIYAKLVAYLVRDINPEVTSNKEELVKDGIVPKGGVLARKLMIISCQNEYSKGWASQLDGSVDQYEMMSDEYYKAMAIKRRGLGLVKFIGELYSMKLINSSVIKRCLHDLSSNVTNPAEDQLETLAQLIITAGPIIDSEGNSELGKKNIFFLDRVFQNVEAIIQLPTISSRIKFKYLDLIDNRKSKWVTKKDQGPKTIAEIHAEAEKEKEKESRRSHKNQGSNYSSKNSGSNWRKVSQNDMNNIGMVRNSSDKGVPTNNFKRNSGRSNTSSSYRSGSNNDSRRSNTHTKDTKEETTESSSGNKNMYHLLGEESEDEDEEEEDDEEEKQAEEENVEEDEKDTIEEAKDEDKNGGKEQDDA